MVPYYIVPFSEKLQIAHLIHENPDLVQHYANIYTLYSAAFDFASRPLFLGIYIFVCFGLLFKYQVQSNNHRYTLRWLYLFLILLLLENILYSVTIYLLINSSFGFSFELVQQMHNVTGAGFFVVPIILLSFFPQILYGHKKSKSATRKNHHSTNQDVTFFELSERINTYMREEQAYLNPDLDISDISFALKVPRHHIAYCFTNVLESKFSSFKNRLRIEHAKKLLEDGEAQLNSIDGIGAKSGFKSRSSFFMAFKVETGMTPNQYIKNLAK
jgi:AraC-like DNA-binding protein